MAAATTWSFAVYSHYYTLLSDDFSGRFRRRRMTLHCTGMSSAASPRRKSVKLSLLPPVLTITRPTAAFHAAWMLCWAWCSMLASRGWKSLLLGYAPNVNISGIAATEFGDHLKAVSGWRWMKMSGVAAAMKRPVTCLLKLRIVSPCVSSANPNDFTSFPKQRTTR